MRITPRHLLLVKPPAAVLPLLVDLRQAYGITASYAATKLHATLLPLGYAPDGIDQLKEILERFSAPPFRIVFDRIESTLLRPSEPIRGMERFQHRLVDHLARHGMRVPDYTFRPHISLSYGERSPARSGIDPVSWLNREFLLIESFRGRHRVLRSWQLA